MTREEINEKIAEWFEPKPTVVSQADGVPRPVRSPKGVWHIGWKYLTLTTFTNFVTPIDFDTDEAANAMLLEAMLAADYAIEFCVVGSQFVVKVRPPKDYVGKVYPNPDRKLAVLHAFCKFAGIEI